MNVSLEKVYKNQLEENRKIILYIDDDKVTCIAGVRTLQKKFPEFNVISCRDYNNAYEKILESCAKIALVCLDYHLGDSENTGGDIARLLYLLEPQIPIISISNTPKEWGDLEKKCLSEIMPSNSKFGKKLNDIVTKILGI